MRERRRGGQGGAGWLPLGAGVLVSLVCGLALSLTHHPLRPVVPSRIAVRAALHDPATRQVLAGAHWTHATVNSLDDQLEHVTFFAGGRLLESVTVDRSLHVRPGVDGRTGAVPYGNWIAYEPAVLAALAGLFVVMAGVSPWRRLRNLDVAACLSFLAPIVLLRHEYIDASVLTALPGMLYLLSRCLWVAFGRPRGPAHSRPLFALITPRLDAAGRVRWLRVLLLVLALLYLMVGVGSPVSVDVIYAVMEGATRLIHGVLPYGHMPPGVVHGDTYPILSYALYAPLALVAPVNTTWDSVDAGLAVAVLVALGAGWALVRAVAPRPRSAHAEEGGLRAALAWLAFPPLLITVSTGTTDVAMAAMLAVALLLWRRPAACTAMLAFAGWFKLAPFALLPLRLAPLRGRRLLCALVTVLAVSAPPLGLLLALGGLHGPAAMMHAMSFQFSRGSLQSVWSALGITRLEPLAEGAVLGLLAASVVRLRREPALADEPVRMAALTAAILLGLQLAAQYWAFLYLVWLGPLVGLSLLADAAPAGHAVALRARRAGAPDPATAIAA
jgi:hypothetical protein